MTRALTFFGIGAIAGLTIHTILSALDIEPVLTADTDLALNPDEVL